MAALTTEELDYWGDLFECHQLHRYMTFGQFIADPKQRLEDILQADYRPLLTKQREVSKRLLALTASIEAELDRLESTVEDMRRIDNGHLYEPLKHHSHPR